MVPRYTFFDSEYEYQAATAEATAAEKLNVANIILNILSGRGGSRTPMPLTRRGFSKPVPYHSAHPSKKTPQVYQI